RTDSDRRRDRPPRAGGARMARRGEGRHPAHHADVHVPGFPERARLHRADRCACRRGGASPGHPPRVGPRRGRDVDAQDRWLARERLRARGEDRCTRRRGAEWRRPVSEPTYLARITEDMTAAMKAKDAATLSTLRMLKATMMEARVKKVPAADLSRDEEL